MLLIIKIFYCIGLGSSLILPKRLSPWQASNKSSFIDQLNRKIIIHSNDAKDLWAIFKPEQANILDVLISTSEDDTNDILKEFYKTYGNYEEEYFDFDLNITEQPFSVEINRKVTNEAIFSFSESNLNYSTNYREFSILIPTDKIFGLGERNTPNFKLTEGTYTIFNHDEVGAIWEGNPGKQTYGSHPMFLMQEESGNFSIVFLQNSYAMDVEYKNLSLRFRMLGGPIHLKIFLGDQYPETVTKLYHDYLNGYTTPPFWALGFHQSKYGYESALVLENVLSSYEKYSIPIDVIWSDIDYMNSYQGFTVSEKYAMEKLLEIKKRYRVKYVPIIDPGIPIKNNSDSNSPYINGLKDDVFLYSPDNGKYFMGYTWGGWVHYVDFLHPKAYNYWVNLLQNLKLQLPFDGLWLDMNEVSDFSGSSDKDTLPSDVEILESNVNINRKAPEFNLNFFMPGGGNIKDNSLPLHMQHYGQYSELQIHNLYAYYECKSTFKVLKENLNIKLPFLLTRATFSGSGATCFHWSGDNLSTFEFLRISIPSIFSMNLFGIPFNGADICGFYQNTTPELCARWIQLGSLYPFSRNHNHVSSINQEFYVLGETVTKAARLSLNLRYSILKHLYSIFLGNNGRGTFFRPLFFEYPLDENVFRSEILNEEFMIGPSLLVTPILYEGNISKTVYLPDDSWTFLETGIVLKKENNPKSNYTVVCNLDQAPPVLLRGGFALSVQSTDQVFRTSDLTNEYKIKASLSYKKATLFNDTSEGIMIGYAQGQMLGLNYFSEENVYSKCLESKSCLINYNIKLYNNYGISNKSSPCSLIIEFNNNEFERKSILETVTINEIYIANFPLSDCPQTAKADPCLIYYKQRAPEVMKCEIKKYNNFEGYDFILGFPSVDASNITKIHVLLTEPSKAIALEIFSYITVCLLILLFISY